ncbi:hypothetical protein C8J56DRAFT_954644 [Mycena floridula]|nr:hypothetical protein C8J56DRAFT_954644 [Mycena floridula]
MTAIYRRLMSTGQFPFPATERPSPHQIFHLSHNASQEEIKKRYYELVRMHHPDSSLDKTLSSAQKHVRFQAITAAYDTLRSSRTRGLASVSSDDLVYREEIERRRRIFKNRQGQGNNTPQPEASKPPPVELGWKDQAVVGFGVILICVGVAPDIFLYPFKM